MKNKTKKGLNYWIHRLKTNTCAFFKNPRQFTRDYISSFKSLDTKGKIKKILLTIVALYVLREIFILFIAVVFLFGMPGLGSAAAKDVAAENEAFERTYAEGGNFYQHYDDIRHSM